MRCSWIVTGTGAMIGRTIQTGTGIAGGGPMPQATMTRYSCHALSNSPASDQIRILVLVERRNSNDTNIGIHVLEAHAE